MANLSHARSKTYRYYGFLSFDNITSRLSQVRNESLRCFYMIAPQPGPVRKPSVQRALRSPAATRRYMRRTRCMLPKHRSPTAAYCLKTPNPVSRMMLPRRHVRHRFRPIPAPPNCIYYPSQARIQPHPSAVRNPRQSGPAPHESKNPARGRAGDVGKLPSVSLLLPPGQQSSAPGIFYFKEFMHQRTEAEKESAGF